MNSKTGAFCLLLRVLILTALFLPGKIYADGIHTVQRGETFFSIARQYGISQDDLMRHNNFTDPTRLQAGQVLRIPNQNTAPSAIVNGQQNQQEGYLSYRVQRGDTFFALTRRHSVTERAIREANNLSDTYILREGDLLRIPLQNAPTAATPIATPMEQNINGTLNQNQISQARPTESANFSSAISWPVNAREISYLTGRLSGVMITGVRSEPVLSLTSGTVISIGPYRGFGRVAIVQVDGGYLYVYGGCESLSVREGDRISAGSEIGRLGIDNVTNLPQLFFMVYRSNTAIDPALAPRTL